jgi:hypothetical protein
MRSAGLAFYALMSIFPALSALISIYASLPTVATCSTSCIYSSVSDCDKRTDSFSECAAAQFRDAMLGDHEVGQPAREPLHLSRHYEPPSKGRYSRRRSSTTTRS